MIQSPNHQLNCKQFNKKNKSMAKLNYIGKEKLMSKEYMLEETVKQQ